MSSSRPCSCGRSRPGCFHLRFGREGVEKASSDIDILVIGDVGFGEVVASLNMVEKQAWQGD